MKSESNILSEMVGIKDQDIDCIFERILAGVSLYSISQDRAFLLQRAVELQNCSVVKILLESGVEIPKEKPPLLVVAAMNADLETARLLIDFGANVNERDLRGVSALMRAAQSGHIGLVSLLLYWGAEVSAQDRDGDTALWFSVKHHNLLVSRLLLKGGASIDEIRSDYPEIARELESEVLSECCKNYGDQERSGSGSIGL